MDAAQFTLGELVVHKTDPSGDKGVLTGIVFRPAGVTYLVTWPSRNEETHYAVELEGLD